VTDLTTLTDHELDLERTSRHDAYSRVYYSLSSTTVADANLFLDALEPGGIKLIVRASYNYELTEAHVFAVAYVKQVRATDFVWREFFVLDDKSCGRVVSASP
jgi:hypothetical protein